MAERDQLRAESKYTTPPSPNISAQRPNPLLIASRESYRPDGAKNPNVASTSSWGRCHPKFIGSTYMSAMLKEAVDEVFREKLCSVVSNGRVRRSRLALPLP